MQVQTNILDFEWPLNIRPEFSKTLQDVASNKFCFVDLAHPNCSLGNLHHLMKRTTKDKGPDMPVVFMPQGDKTECERTSRMSSWGFMSFVLAVVNGVINISNNINNNNNNRNNNNNDDNNNQYNVNLGNTNNVQMAGGMAMAMGRKIKPLDKIRAIRDRIRRKFETKMQGFIGQSEGPTKVKSASYMTAQTSSTTELPIEIRNEAVAVDLMGKLYETEIVQKEKTKESIREQVSELLQKMYRDQKNKVKSRSSRSLKDECDPANELVNRSSLIALAFINLWVEIHQEELSDEDMKERYCRIISKSRDWGQVTSIVAENIGNHMQYLTSESVTCDE